MKTTVTFRTVAPFLAVALFLSAPAPLVGQGTARTVPPPVTRDNAADDAETILGRYVEAWRGRQAMTIPDTFRLGFRVRGDGGGDFHAVVPPDGPAALSRGPADRATVVFETDMATLRRIDAGEWNALTAMAQARSGDPVPLVPRFPEGFRWTPENRALHIPFAFHFWNREWPAVIRFGDGTTRTVHGAEATVVYYGRGLRTGWYQLNENVHVNADPSDQRNPFDSLFIVTRGSVRARLGGTERRLSEGEAVLVPAGMTHEFWTAPGEYGEAIVVMFGEGA